MSEHPIQGLMKTAMENLKEMVDVNTIVGEPVETPDGSVIVPVSKVGFGFAAGGSEFGAANADGANSEDAKSKMPFGGGSGGGVSITPVAFLVVGKSGVKVLTVDTSTHLFDRIIDSAPQVFDRIQGMINKNNQGQQGQKNQGDDGQTEVNIVM